MTTELSDLKKTFWCSDKNILMLIYVQKIDTLKQGKEERKEENSLGRFTGTESERCV